jgi:acetyl esterase/lipase
MIVSRKDIHPQKTRFLLERGILPVSVDYRLCPEVTLTEGPMADVCAALGWIRNPLPNLPTSWPDVLPDGNKVDVVGWSTGGTLSMALPFNAPARGGRPPDS